MRVLIPSMHAWLDRFDFWPELISTGRTALNLMTADKPMRPVAFEQAIAFALRQDGPQLGFDQALYDSLRAAAGHTSRHLSAMDENELRDLAHSNFWLATRADEMPEKIARDQKFAG